MDVDARALCKAAGSLKRLYLGEEKNCTLEGVAEVFGHRSLEELDFLFYIYSAVAVSSACSPGM